MVSPEVQLQEHPAMRTGIAATSLALAFFAGTALAALAQTGGGSSSALGTANVNPGSISKETVGGAANKDTGNTGTAGTAYTGTSNRETVNNPLGTNPFDSGAPNPTGGKGQQRQNGTTGQ
jgi:hypothetical protein